MKEKHPVKAVITGILYVVVFVVLVWLGITILLGMEPEMEFLFNNTLFYAVMLGIPMSALAALGAYFEPGEMYRLIFTVSCVIVSLFYFVFVLGSLDLGWHGDEFVYSISMGGILILIIILMVLKVGYNITEYALCRNKLKAGNDERDELLRRAKGLKQEGWLVDDLIETIKTDTEQGRKALEWYEGRIESLRWIKSKFESLGTHEYQLSTEKLERDMMDPRNDPAELEDRVDKLADHINDKKM